MRFTPRTNPGPALAAALFAHQAALAQALTPSTSALHAQSQAQVQPLLGTR